MSCDYVESSASDIWDKMYLAETAVEMQLYYIFTGWTDFWITVRILRIYNI